MGCFLYVAKSKPELPNGVLYVLGMFIIFSLWQWVNSFNLTSIRKLKTFINLLQIQRKKINNLESNIQNLKQENILLTKELTGLHKMWMEQPPPLHKPMKTTKESIIKNDAILAQIEYSGGIDDSFEKYLHEESNHLQETDLIEKSSL